MAVQVCPKCGGSGKSGGTRSNGKPEACRNCGGFGCMPLPPPKKGK